MPGPGDHMIRKATVNFNLTGDFDGVMLQQEVTEWCRNALSPAISSVLSEYDLSDKIIAIESLRVDIDLGNTPDWKTNLADQMKHQLKENLHDKIISSGIDVLKKSSDAGFTDSLIYYLRFGFLSWNSSFKNREDFNQEFMDWIRNNNSTEIIDTILKLDDGRSIIRLAAILEEGSFEEFIFKLTGDHEALNVSVFQDVMIIISYLDKDKKHQSRYLAEFKQILLGYSLRGDDHRITGEFYARWLYPLAVGFPAQFRKIDPDKIRNREIKGIIRSVIKDISEDTVSQKARKNDGLIIPPGMKMMNGEPGKESRKELLDGAFIVNAGAVIIAPFLVMLFTRTGLTRDYRIINEPVAISLLNYCITGNSDAVEFDLLLLKVLCGVPPEAIIEIEPLADEKMTREADEMLGSVIEHWSVLKETSVEGLREAFLQRNGKLVYSEDDWLLFVEQKPYDMLLNSLPWNIGTIRLPWMNNALKVQWI